MYRLRRPSTRATGCDERRRDIRPAAAEETVTRLLARAWLERFRPQRVHLRAAAPGRSRQPARYRDLIVQTAEHILRTALYGNVSWADCNETMQAALPDWFGQPGIAENTSHQHLSRARRDVQDVLKAIVSRDELLLRQCQVFSVPSTHRYRKTTPRRQSWVRTPGPRSGD